jgi:hypothetical protein
VFLYANVRERKKMTNEEMNQKFEEIVKPVKPKREKRPAAKFPELRYLWGVALLGTFVLTVLVSIFTTILEAV